MTPGGPQCGNNSVCAAGQQVLEKISGTKSDEVTGDLRKMHNEKLHNLCSSAIIRMITRMRWATHVACMGDMRTVNTTLDETSDRK